MNQLVAIAIGGAFGALLRFLVSTGIYDLMGRNFPYGTLFVNILGGLLMGFLSVILLEYAASVEWRAALLIGFLGAFTTFSTFSIETLNLLLQGEVIKGLLNALLSVILCVVATWIGLLLAKYLS